MNWNSANMSGLKPITLRFSKLVGDILREVPESQEPLGRHPKPAIDRHLKTGHHA